jgi:CHAT domain-containing protein
MLHVVLDGKLTDLPVAALHHGGAPLIAMRPVVRALRLPETGCAHVTRTRRATVLGNPRRNLPGAQTEAEQVARLLGTTSKTGAAATSTALFAAAHDDVLHIAAHRVLSNDGAALELADRNVSALEISAQRLAPSLVVLSACEAATSGDSEIAGSLVAGFLGAGSQHVVATLRPISDSGALDISTQFYGAGGLADPARALREVQAALAKTDNTDWPYFAVFGPDVCRNDAP